MIADHKRQFSSTSNKFNYKIGDYNSFNSNLSCIDALVIKAKFVATVNFSKPMRIYVTNSYQLIPSVQTPCASPALLGCVMKYVC